MATERPSLATRLLLWLADAICRHRPWFGWPHLVLSLLGLYVTLVNPQLKFRTERNALVGGDKQYHRIFMEFRKEFPSEDDIVVVTVHFTKDNGELSSVTLDENSKVEVVP